MWWLLIPGILLLGLLILLFIPIWVDVNSETGLIGIRYGRLAEFSLVFNEEVQAMKLRIAWWKKMFPLVQIREKKEETREQVPRQRRKRKKQNIGALLRKLKEVVLSFRITTCRVSVDTGDMPTNAVLYPWFYLWRLRTGKNISISFTGENVVILQAQNTIARMAWAFIKS